MEEEDRVSKMKKVVIATILMLLVGAMFVGIAKAENFGYWPSENGIGICGDDAK